MPEIEDLYLQKIQQFLKVKWISETDKIAALLQALFQTTISANHGWTLKDLLSQQVFPIVKHQSISNKILTEDEINKFTTL